MNELAIVFDYMGIDTNEVIEAMNTKWNALNFRPGLVGGHCIGVDPYYFIYKAENLGYHSQIIASGRKINDDMASFVADAIIKKLISTDKIVKKSKIAILGITFKENCTDIRNSKIIDIIMKLKEYGIKPIVVDPLASKEEVKKEYKIELSDFNELREMDCLVFAVAHNLFKSFSFSKIDSMYGKISPKEKILIDIKGMFSIPDLEKSNYTYWRL